MNFLINKFFGFSKKFSSYSREKTYYRKILHTHNFVQCEHNFCYTAYIHSTQEFILFFNSKSGINKCTNVSFLASKWVDQYIHKILYKTPKEKITESNWMTLETAANSVIISMPSNPAARKTSFNQSHARLCQ